MKMINYSKKMISIKQPKDNDDGKIVIELNR